MLAWTRAALRVSCSHARASPAPRVHLARTFTSSLHLNLPRLALEPRQRQQQRTTKDSDGELLERDSYHLASQVRRLTALGKGDVTAALNLVRAAPANAATVVVWNVLLNAILVSSATAPAGPAHAQAVRKAYDVWMEMKRRGITPSARGYGTILTGAAKRAKQSLDEVRRGKKHEGWNAELRAKVDTVHKQWLVHCERVLAKGDDGDLVGSSGLSALDGGEVEAAARDVQDGRADTAVDLSAVPTNQYLAFLSSSLALSTVADKPAPAPAPEDARSVVVRTPIGPAILRQFLQIFHAMPDSDDPSETLARLGRTGVSYSIMLGALRTALQASCASGAVQGEAGWPTPSQLLDTALDAWKHLVEHPPAPDVATSNAAPLSPVIPSTLLSLFLIPSSAVLPASYFTRSIAVAQAAFGFVPPAELSSLVEPTPADLPVPLCTPLDAPALGVALRLVAASGKKDWVRVWWEQVRDYPGRFGLAQSAADDVRAREEGEVVIRACGAASDVEGIEDILNYLLSPSLRLSPLHRPDLSTFTLALTSLARIGTPAAVDASLRIWSSLLTTLDPSPLPAIKPHYAPAADALLRTALATRDRGQIWRAFKAIALPADSPSPSPLGPSAFPPPQRAATKEGMRALAQSFATALGRVLAAAPGGRDSLPAGAVPRDQRDELEAWSERIGAWLKDAATEGAPESGAAAKGGDYARREGEGEMEWRRRMVALKRAQDEARGDKPAHTERRRRWWSERQEEWAQVRAEREKTGDGNRVPRNPPVGGMRRDGTARGEQPRKSDGGDRPRRFDGGDRPRRFDGGDRPRRSEDGERPRRFEGGERRSDGEDRPRRFGGEDRPRRFDSGKEEGRPRFEPRGDRPRFERRDGDRPDRPSFERRDRRPDSDRPRHGGRDSERREDRPRRFEGRRSDGERGDRPRRRDVPPRSGGQPGWDQ